MINLSIIIKVLQGLGKLLIPAFLYKSGQDSVKSKQNKKNAKILKKQRDNNVSTVSDAKQRWMRLRKKHK